MLVKYYSLFNRSMIYYLSTLAMSASLSGCLDQLNDPNNKEAVDRVSAVLGNTLPQAQAGLDQAVVGGVTVLLDGGASHDKEGGIHYQWRQLTGTSVTLQNAETSQATFIAPLVQTTEALQFELLVTDHQGWPANDYINVTVNPAASPTTTLKGKFIASPQGVAGLAYQTKTQSGMTSSTGEFNYQSGEAITFKVGDIVLGKTLAKSQLSPFDLVEIDKPPVTAAETSQTLRLMENSPAPISFEIATNIVTFLQTLDVDSDLTNGISIPETINTIATGKLLRFDQESALGFKNNAVFKHIIGEGRLAGLWGGNKGTQVYTKVLDDLYGGLSLVPNIPKVASDLHSKTNSFSGFSSLVEAYDFNTTTQELNKNVRLYNNLTELTNKFDLKIVNLYNSFGSLAEQKRYVIDYDINGDKLRDEVVLGYDKNNYLIENKQIFRKFEFNSEATYSDSTVYDNYGQATSLSTLSDGQTMPEVYESHDYTYYPSGLIKADKANNAIYTYDTLGRELSYSNTTKNEAGTITSTYSTTMDWANLVQVDTTKKDLNSDGELDISYQKTFKYDHQLRVLDSKVESDTDGDKKWNSIETYQATYDNNGNRTNYNKQTDSNGDGTVDQNYRETLVLDSSKSTLTIEEDSKGDGVFKVTEIETKQLDSDGNWIQKKVEHPNTDSVDHTRSYKNYSQWFPLYQVGQEPDKQLIINEVYN